LAESGVDNWEGPGCALTSKLGRLSMVRRLMQTHTIVRIADP
jgi:hypothetical protein